MFNFDSVPLSLPYIPLSLFCPFILTYPPPFMHPSFLLLLSDVSLLRSYFLINFFKCFFFLQISFTDEVVFKLLNSNHFPYKGFASYKYYKNNTFDMFLGIRRNGLPKRATKTSATKKDTKFLIIYTNRFSHT